MPDELSIPVAAFKHLIRAPGCDYLGVGTMFASPAFNAPTFPGMISREPLKGASAERWRERDQLCPCGA